MSDALERELRDCERLLSAAGFLTEPPPPGTWSDHPLVAIYTEHDDSDLAGGEIVLVLMCANQCVRDERHLCGVNTTLTDLITGHWVPDASHARGWMVLTWGMHVHSLAFCSTNCLTSFVERRALESEVRERAN